MTPQQTAEAEMTLERSGPLPVRPGPTGPISRLVPLALRRRILGLGWGWLSVLGCAGVLIVVLLFWAGVKGLGGMASDRSIKTAEVKRGTLKVYISADGTIRSDKTVDIKSEVEGLSRILDIVPESTRIDGPGKFLVQLDVADLVKARDSQEIKVKQAQSAATQAERELDIQKASNESAISSTKVNRELADIELNKYVKGDYPQAKLEAETAIIIANAEVKRAEDKYQSSVKLAANGYISASEKDADELDLQRFKLNLVLAKEKLTVLKDYSYRKEYGQRKSTLDQAESELERTLLRCKANDEKAVTDLETKREAATLEEEQLAKFNKQITAGRVVSPQGGLVVYASTGRPRFGSQQNIEVGYQVREGETLIALPDLNVMVADVNVPEAKRTAIEEGLAADVIVESQPKSVLYGRVKSRSVLPVQQDWRRSGDVQLFQVVVAIDNPPEWLLPGLRCRARVFVRQLDDVLMVPIQAVFLKDETHFCYVREQSGRIRGVPVLTGLDDDNMVEIKAGLKEGWAVLQAEPENPARVQVEKPTFDMPATAPPPTTQPTSANPPPPDRPPGDPDAP